MPHHLRAMASCGSEDGVSLCSFAQTPLQASPHNTKWTVSQHVKKDDQKQVYDSRGGNRGDYFTFAVL